MVDGRLKPGDRLPSSREMSRMWKAPEPTIHSALVPLVKEGLLERTPKVGTFVRKREERLTKVGIYVNGDLWRTPAYAFGRALCNELHKQLDGADMAESVWVDPRPRAEQGQSWDELVRAAAERRIQVLIVPVVDLPQIAWLEKLPIPVVYLTSAKIHNRVAMDMRQWAGDAMEILAGQGCRKVGAICSVRLPSGDSAEHPHQNRSFIAALESSAVRLGLEFRPEWFLRPEKDFVDGTMDIPRFGFESMQALWRQSERPEGIVVYDDVTASGVLMAVMREQIKVPENLQLVLHRNAEVGLFCPFPAAFMDVHVAEVAAALIMQATCLHNGEEVTAKVVPHHAVPAPGLIGAMG